MTRARKALIAGLSHALRIDEGRYDLFVAHVCKFASVDHNGSDFIADCETFYLEGKLTDVASLPLSVSETGKLIAKLLSASFTDELILKLGQPVDQIFH